MYREVIGIIPFLNDGITLAKNAFVLAQFIAPLARLPEWETQNLIMIFYFSEMVLGVNSLPQEKRANTCLFRLHATVRYTQQ